MWSDDTRAKAARLVKKGRAVVSYASEDVLTGAVYGSRLHKVTFDPEGIWCDCTYGTHHPAAAYCSHTAAVVAVAMAEGLVSVAVAATLGHRKEPSL